MKKALTTALVATAMLTLPAINAGDGHAGHNHAGHNHPSAKPEAGTIVKRTLAIKGIAIIEFVQNQTIGKVTLTVMNEHKKALTPEKTPRLNLIVNGKHKQLKTVVNPHHANVFTVSDDALKAALNGKVAVKVGGKTHQVVIDPHFGHNHGPGAQHH